MASMERSLQAAAVVGNVTHFSVSEAEIQIKDSILAIDQQAWNHLCRPQQFMRHEYLRALEASDLDCQYAYALAFVGGELVGIALATTWRIAVTRKLSFRVTTMGTPVNTGLPLAVLVRSDLVDLPFLLVTALQKFSASQGIRLFIGRDFPEPDYVQRLVLEKLYNCAYLDLCWDTFEQYLSQHPKRKGIRRDLRSLEKAGYQLEIRKGVPLSSVEAHRIHELWLQLYSKHQSPDQIKVSQDFFMQLSLLPHSVYLLLKKEDRIDAFDLCFVLGDQLESTYCGVDLTVTKRLSVHRAMGYHIVRYALEEKLRCINFGISNEQGKVEMGCRLNVRYAWLVASPAWLGLMLRPLLRRFVLEQGGSRGQGAAKGASA
ncbi:MAG TPA: GNAT family N-acetyltransferase [Alcaligenes faecalis]|nr:GNAT family N-acetyltransferase [Alcaligenes faecalis]